MWIKRTDRIALHGDNIASQRNHAATRVREPAARAAGGGRDGDGQSDGR